jgi:uncharacterized membrane protein YfcA
MLAGGLIAGTVSGMGVGGGAILIPLLCIFAGMDQRTAQCVNLLYFIPTGIIAVITHVKNGKIDKQTVKGMVFYGLAGSAGGAFIALAINQEFLRKAFGVFLLAVGLYELFKKDGNNEKDKEKIKKK